uniref:Exonuclease domain-containing protein n=1 Tax=Monopterus albus TaxID=43700 RepID=A0A3Q3IJU6_MONAL
NQLKDGCKVSVNDESRDDCLQQLERINKEIESVRHEVEQERRRLSRYQTTQTDGNNSVPNLSVSNPETAGKNVDGSSHGLSSCTDFTKPYAQARKYVVDNSKPRTDLEYDPLSNFSADLRSYSSSGKEQKVKGQDLKRPRNTVTCNQEKPLPYQAPLSRSPSPEPLDDSYEDNILVIDIPPSPEKKRGRTQKLDCVSGKSQNGEEILNKVKTAPSLLDSTAELFKDKFASRFEANKVHNCDAENELGKDVVDLFKKKKCENIPADEKVIDLTGCLEDLESECQRITCLSAAERAVENNPQPTVLSATSDQQNHSCNKMAMEEEKNPFQIEFPQWELPHSVEKMNQLQPCDLPLKNFLFNKEPAANSDSPCRQHTAQAPTTELSAKGRVHNHCSPKQIIPSLVPDSQKPSQVQMQGKASISHTPSVMYQEQAEPGSSQFQAWHISSSAYSDLTNGAEPTEQILVKADDAVVIVDSSSDEDEEFTFRSKEVEAELSDSDPMEECYRIFMEANNEVKGHEEHSGVSVTYMNYIPFGTAVIDMGSNLHLILPESSFSLPVSSSSSPITSILTPITPVHPSTVAVIQTQCSPAVTPVQRYRTTAPVLIPALALPTKRKVKQQCEAAKDKVPHDVRQRYVSLFTEEFRRTTASVNDAFEKALAEERTIYSRSVNKLKYLSVAVNALKRLKNQNTVAAKGEINHQKSKGNVPLNWMMLKGNDDVALYESLKDYILTEERLIESNYPVQHPEKPGFSYCITRGNTCSCSLKRLCCRCGTTFSVSQTGKHIRKEECNYHYGKGVENRVPGGVETRYSCCEGDMGAPGCQVFRLHVHNSLSLDGFVSTGPRQPSDTSCPGVYSLDCEMCYTIHGLELSRVTVVNSSLQVIYDTFVRPDNEVVDYDTRFSGISEEDVKGNHTSLREVQKTLLGFISADTILIGHGLEADLCALKLLHGTVVDTSAVFPHRLGPPHKLTLNNLTADYLRRIIQESVCGHDTAEDAAACMELMLWKVKEDGKMKNDGNKTKK